MNVNVADALLSVILVWILVPRFGISGYLFSIYFSELFNTVLSIHHLLLISHTPVRLFKWVYKPLLCIVGATTAVRAILEVTGFYIANTALSILLHVLSVVLLYLLLLRLTGAVDREDVAWTRALFRVREK